MAVNYQPLEAFLRATPANVSQITLSFQQIELILGDRLPPSHLDHRQWWENQSDTRNRPQARAWLNAGFTVEIVNQNDGWVQFLRI